MKYNPKVVSIDRSAAYVHHRAMKNRRDNNALDALELMRHAVEHSPQNPEYRLDLAEMYCEMGCHELSNRILLDMIAEPDAPAECYYGLALNQLGKNEYDSARRALMLYRRRTGDDEYADEASGLVAEIEIMDSLRRPLNRRLARAYQISDHACEALKAENPAKACRLFSRSLSMNADQPEMRALYALALRLCGDDDAARAEAARSVESAQAGVRAVCVAAQVFKMCGDEVKAGVLARRAIEARPDGVELRLLIFALGEMEMPLEAAEAIRTALREAPYDKTLLHMRAVALHLSGADDAQLEPFWLRILRIDPSDTVAMYYHEAARRGELAAARPSYLYEVPDAEYRRRIAWIADILNAGLEGAVARWKADRGFRDMLMWAVSTGDDGCGRAAVMVMAMAGDAESESALRELLYRGDVPMAVKLHATLFLKLRGAQVQKLLPPDSDASDGMLPEADALLENMPVGERQLVRFTDEVLSDAYGVMAASALALMWCRYRSQRQLRFDPLERAQEAAAALAWNYLLRHKRRVRVRKLAWYFDCAPRRMVYYARRMAAVLEADGGEDGDEDR